ncbi:MAG: extracellular solute-binding protein [Lachnospiraceae bacterium]|nr:extracellular solute-binding protein [Lachnospiraceae bacterium]
MRNRKQKQLIKWAIIGVVILAVIVYLAWPKSIPNYEKKYAGQDLTAPSAVGYTNTYAQYREKYANKKAGTQTITVDLTNISEAKDSFIETIEGEKSLVTKDGGSVVMSVNVPEEGLYTMYIEYFPLGARKTGETYESRGVDPERALYFYNAETRAYELPFRGCDAFTFSRIWTDGAEVKVDNRGNEIRPIQVEAPRWESLSLHDFQGYEKEPYEFYFPAGETKIQMKATNETMAIRKIELRPLDKTPTYQEYLAKNPASEYTNRQTDFIASIQGEDAEFRSTPSLYRTYDHASANTEPYSITKTVYNMIGGTQWRVAGDWIEWDFEVPEDGYYEISVKGRQYYNRGYVSNRKVMIDGEVPFEEASVVSFPYSSDWVMKTIADADGNPYKFALKKGKHTIRLEVTLGELGDILKRMDESVARMNDAYRQIIVLTGTEPDVYRDYHIEREFPDVMTAMDKEYKILYKIVDDLVAYSGEKGTQVASTENLAITLERFAKRPSRITKGLAGFKESVAQLGTDILTLSEQQLDIDAIYVSAVDAEVPKVNKNFFSDAMHEIRSFVASFVIDYNSLGDTYSAKDENTVNVWILTGRDQSQVLKAMIDDTFTPNYHINVNLKLVTSAALMPAVVAGNGPDIVLTTAQGDPVNYAIRGAAYNLANFSDLEEVTQHFYESALLPYRYDTKDEDGTVHPGLYAIPETQYYNVMFYRTDVMEKLGLQAPETWDELIAMLPAIQSKNLNVAIPSVERMIGGMMNPDLSSFFAMLYQKGGVLYDDDHTKVLLDEQKAVEAFEMYTKFFTHYKTPRSYDFSNRFRSGEIPLGMADYNTYNTLAVFAPEIRGLWKFGLVPGTKQEDGTIDHSTGCWGQCSMMLSSVRDPEKAWTFMKWWASPDVQTRFGRELEAVMGDAARYATANKDAFKNLGWKSEDRDVLSAQWEWVKCNPEVPGGYYTSRHITNAVRAVVNRNDDARETLLDYTRDINDEIAKKRKEFGLSTGKEEDK